WIGTSVRWLCDLRPRDDARAHDGSRRARVHAGSRSRRVPAHAPALAHPREHLRVCEQRVQPAPLGSADQALRERMPGRQRRTSRPRLQHALDRLARGRDASHPAARRCIHVSARSQGSHAGRTPASAVRSEPDRFHRRTGRRTREHRARAAAGSHADQPARAHRVDLRHARRGRAYRELLRRVQGLRVRRASVRCSHFVQESRLMSAMHPIIAVTGSSGAGTTSVMKTFEQIFRREGITAAFVEGDSFHRYDRVTMKQKMAEALARGDVHFSHFGPQANLLEELEGLFKTYGETGQGRRRFYLHDEAEAAKYGQPPGTFTEWEPLPENTDLLFYEGLHG